MTEAGPTCAPLARLRAACIALALFAVLASAGRATLPGPQPAAAAAAPAHDAGTPAAPSGYPEVKVTGVRRLRVPADNPEARIASLKQDIEVSVVGLRGLLERAKCEGRWKVPGCKPQHIALFLDGRRVNGIVPVSAAARADTGTLQYQLARNQDNDVVWADLLGRPPLGRDFFKRGTAVSVGLEDGYAEPSDVEAGDFAIVRVKPGAFWAVLGALVLLVFALYKLGKRWDMLRDPRAAGSDSGDTGERPFSLGRCQMAFWFVLIMGSFAFIWLITNAQDIVNSTALALIGIGAGTALGAAAIDAGRSGAARDAATAATAAPTRHSKGLLNDLIEDANGISFHRFQMVIWTVVLGVLFLHSVWDRLSMPDFSATLLALMGISSGTYLGFKIPQS